MGKSEKPLELLETADEIVLNDKDLKTACFAYARENFQGKRFLNKETGRKILVSRDGLDEWESKSKSRAQILSIKKLDALLQESSLLQKRPDTEGRYDIENFSYFSKEISINGKMYDAVITVRKTRQVGDKYYHHYLKDIKLEPRSGNWHTSGNPASDAPLLHGSSDA
jgi:hypothetical protein